MKDVVHVEIWDYSMRRFAEGASATDIFSEVNDELQTKDVKGLSRHNNAPAMSGKTFYRVRGW